MKILCKSCNTYDADFENLLLIFFFYAVVISNVVCLFFKDLRVYNSVPNSFLFSWCISLRINECKDFFIFDAK